MGLSSNKLKIIAIILMVLDHIGYYFVSYISEATFDILRFLGRMSMPIFAFLIVQGFFNTNNLKKYIYRLFITATSFQLVLFILGIINELYVDNYYIVINTYLNILYSFVLCLILLWLIDTKTIVNNKFINIIIKSVGMILILLIYHFIDMELGYRVLVTIVGFYFSEKMKRSGKSEELIAITMFMTLVLAVISDFDNLVFNLPSIISIIFISMYNGERGKNNKLLKNIFYFIYPLHHTILYILALFITHKVR